jgi:hypothetical protein
VSAPQIFFYLFGAAAVVSALGMVLNVRNTVAAAMCLVVTMISLGGIYVVLDAHLVAALQIMVYAGAIVVVFLFVVMLLNLRRDAFPPATPARHQGARRRAGDRRDLGVPAARARRAADGARGGTRLRRLPRGGTGAVPRVPAALRDHLAAAAGGDRRRRGAGQAEARLTP